MKSNYLIICVILLISCKNKDSLEFILKEEMSFEKNDLQSFKKFDYRKPLILDIELNGYFIGFFNNKAIFKDNSNKKYNELLSLDETDYSLVKFIKLKKSFAPISINNTGVLGVNNNMICINYFNKKNECINISFEFTNINSNNNFSEITFRKVGTEELYIIDKNRSITKLEIKGYDLKKHNNNIFLLKSTNPENSTRFYLYYGKNTQSLKKMKIPFFGDGSRFSYNFEYFIFNENHTLKGGNFLTKIFSFDKGEFINLGDKSHFRSYFSKVSNRFILYN